MRNEAVLREEQNALRRQPERLPQAGEKPSATVGLLAPATVPGDKLTIVVSGGAKSYSILPADFEAFAFEDGDELAVEPPEAVALLPKTWGDVHIEIQPVYRPR